MTKNNDNIKEKSAKRTQSISISNYIYKYINFSLDRVPEVI